MNRKSFSAKPGILSHPILLAVCIVSALSLYAPVAVAQEATGISGNTSASTELRRYNIPAQPLSEALIEFGKQSGLQVTTGSALVAGKQAPSVSGTLSAEQVLNRLLAGNDLRYEVNGGMVRLASGTETTALPPVRIGAQGLSGMADLPPAYAGGQVARGGRIGLLGNRDIFDTPFSVTSYTAELIENQQARTVADVIRNDSSAYLINPGQGGISLGTTAIRGFIGGGAATDMYDGLPNMTFSSPTVRTLERVEIFKGPNALLNGGVSPAVSGAINLVPKRPTETALTRLTADYDYKSRFGAHADLSRRFGSKKQFGTRLNAVYHKGEAAVEDMEEELGEVALALEYRADKLRLETILDYSSRHLDGGNYGHILSSNATSLPSAPDLDETIHQPWEREQSKFARALLRAEYSPDKTWTLHAAYGVIDSEFYDLRAFNRRDLDANGNFSSRFWQGIETHKKYTWNTGIRGQFKTGEITHQLSVETVRSDERAAIDFMRVTDNDVTSNLYQPRFIARPQFDQITRNPTKTGDNVYSSIAIADTMGFFDERVLLTAGIRRQTIDTKNFNRRTGMPTRQYDKSANTPAVGLVVKPWRFMSIYGNYIEALEQGPTAPRTAINAGEVFPPQETEQIEFGMKFDLDGLGLTAGVFQIERPSGITENRRFSVDGEQRNRGLELNAFGELRPNLRLLGGITYIDSKLTHTQGGRFDGNDAPGVPELAAVLNLQWDSPVLPGLTLTARAEHMGDQYIRSRSDNKVRAPSYELYSIGAHYTRTMGNQKFTFRANVNNLFDKDYWTGFAGDDNYLYLGSPRRMNLSVSMDF